MPARAIVIAAPHSGGGKTIVTLGLIRALRNAGLRVVSAKAGPDYIDPRFHEAASGIACINLDLWAMGGAICRALLHAHTTSADICIIEGVMGLFDGPRGQAGSTADLAMALDLPVVFVADASHQAQSIAALLHGFHHFRPPGLAGVILNRVRSANHAGLLRESFADDLPPLLGIISETPEFGLPSRHLGLVQAMENQQLETIIEKAASTVASAIDIQELVALSRSISDGADDTAVPPLGQHMAIASDAAFSFLYPHLLNSWRAQGAEMSFFSPLADEAPAPSANAVYLPGGYPELHAERLAASSRFMSSLRSFSGLIYGECGGYMVLGEALIDAAGTAHRMAGLLPVETSFASRKLHLGYRHLVPLNAPWPTPLRGHEFHYSTLLRQGPGDPLFAVSDASGKALGNMGLRIGNVMGSYAHIIAKAPS